MENLNNNKKKKTFSIKIFYTVLVGRIPTTFTPSQKV